MNGCLLKSILRVVAVPWLLIGLGGCSQVIQSGRTCGSIESSDDAPGPSVRYLTENKKVIPLTYQCGSFRITNVKLPDLVLVNNSDVALRPVQLDIIGKTGGEQVATSRIGPAGLASLIEGVNSQFKATLSNRTPEGLAESGWATLFGRTAIDANTLCESDTLKPHESAVVLLSKVLFFSYIGQTTVDELEFVFTVKGDGGEGIVTFPINLAAYETKGDYIFPLKGALCIHNLPMNLAYHRQAMSQEFALDVVSARQLGDGRLSTARTDKAENLSEYFIHQREVFAIGGGVVVEIADEFPDSAWDNPQAYSSEAFDRVLRKLAPAIGTQNALCGNYVVIDHENGEFSYYAHLSEGSIQVEAGDRVSQGQVIAKVGNTGHSSEPHLHFQLMDSKDFYAANSLPVMFGNVPPDWMNQNFKVANSLVDSDYFYIHIAE